MDEYFGRPGCHNLGALMGLVFHRVVVHGGHIGWDCEAEYLCVVLLGNRNR